MKARARACAGALVLLGSCSAPERLPEPPATHPASLLADEAPERAPSQTLVMPERKPAAPGTTGRGH
ncbi:MAG: hypothetical protein WAT39_06750 [Planctomycetota bacterium]